MVDPFTILAIGSGIGSLASGFGAQRRADKFNNASLRHAEQQWTMGAPLRRQGLQALGQVESAYDLGNLGFNSANPFAAARGPAPSTATIGNWDRFTTPTEQMDSAVSGLRPDEVEFMNDALNAQYIGRSKGKQRFNNGAGTREFTNDDRNHAKMLRDRWNQNMGYAGIQPLGTRPAAPARPRVGRQPLGG